MKKLLTTLALALALLFGGTVALAPSASAEECPFGVCQPPAPPCEPFQPCGPQPPACEPFQPCLSRDFALLSQRLGSAEQTANDYRMQVVALTEQVADVTARAERLQRVSDRRAATIQRLRARIRALR